MRTLYINIFLALVWVAMAGSVTVGNFVIGFLIGFAILMFQARIVGQPTYAQKAVQFARLVAFLTWEIIHGAVWVSRDVLTLRDYAQPGIVAVPLDAKTDMEIALLANAVSLTPGTLSLDVSADRSTLYVHCMFAADPSRIRSDIKDGLERRILEFLR